MSAHPEEESAASRPPKISVKRNGQNAILRIEAEGLPEIQIEIPGDAASQLGLHLLGVTEFAADDPKAFSEAPTLSARDPFFEVARSDDGTIITSLKIPDLRPIILQWSPRLADYLFAEIGRARGHIV